MLYVNLQVCLYIFLSVCLSDPFIFTIIMQLSFVLLSPSPYHVNDTCTIHSVVHTNSNSYYFTYQYTLPYSCFALLLHTHSNSYYFTYQYTLSYSCPHIHSFTNSPINPHHLLSPLYSCWRMTFRLSRAELMTSWPRCGDSVKPTTSRATRLKTGAESL